MPEHVRRDAIVCGEDGREPGFVGEQRTDVVEFARIRDERTVDVAPRARRGASRSVREPDALVAESPEVCDREPRTSLVVVAHPAGIVGHRFGATDDHERHARGSGGEICRIEMPRHGDDRVDTEIDQALQSAPQQSAIPPSVAEDHAEARFVRGILDPVDDVRVVLVAQVGQEHSDEVAATADKPLRPSVRAVSEPVGRVLDALSARGADARFAAQGRGDERLRHARRTRDVDDRRSGRGGHRSSVPDRRCSGSKTLWNVPDPFTCEPRERHPALVASSS